MSILMYFALNFFIVSESHSWFSKIIFWFWGSFCGFSLFFSSLLAAHFPNFFKWLVVFIFIGGVLQQCMSNRRDDSILCTVHIGLCWVYVHIFIIVFCFWGVLWTLYLSICNRSRYGIFSQCSNMFTHFWQYLFDNSLMQVSFICTIGTECAFFRFTNVGAWYSHFKINRCVSVCDKHDNNNNNISSRNDKCLCNTLYQCICAPPWYTYTHKHTFAFLLRHRFLDMHVCVCKCVCAHTFNSLYISCLVTQSTKRCDASKM